MTLLVDTNILVYAIHRESPQHQAARRFIEGLYEGPGFVLTWSILYEWLRITTHPRIFPRPLAPSEARAFVAQVAGNPRVDILCETPRHCQALDEVLQGSPPLRGNRYHDAHIAAVMREHGVTQIATADRHFRQFDFLQVIDPTSAV